MNVASTINRFQRGRDRFYPIDGEDYVSVTTVTSCLSKGEALMNWAGKLNRERVCEEAANLYASVCQSGAQMPPAWFRSSLWAQVERRTFHLEASKAAADIGTVAHARCEWVVQKRLGRSVGGDPIDACSLTDEDKDRALWASLAFEDWVKDNHVEPVATELVVAHRQHRYAGTLDLLARVNGDVSVIDLKTSSGLYDEMKIQVAAYLNAYNAEMEMAGGFYSDQDTNSHLLATRAYLVRLPKKTTDPDFEAVEVLNLDEHFAAFLALRRVWEWKARRAA